MNWAPLVDEFVAAGKELGFNEIDANGPQTAGADCRPLI
jgi:hypothetical protein